MNTPTIDDLGAEVLALQRRVMSDELITSREMRRLWSARLRPFWRLHVKLYRALSRRFVEQGDNYLATEVADEGLSFFRDDVPLILTRALSAARSGAAQSAQELLRRKQSLLAGSTEAESLLARTFKDLWKTSGDVRYLREAFDLYLHDYRTTSGNKTFPGVNAASMALFLGRAEEGRKLAGEVLAILRAQGEPIGYWERVTLGECLLVDGQIESARQAYARATAIGNIPVSHLATTRAQARLLLPHLGRNASDFDDCFPLPGVIAFTGHRVDAPDRSVPRLPDRLVPEVKERIRQAVVTARAGFGYSAAANGADILFLEVMQELGRETYIHLPFPEDEFIRRSVEHAASPAWLDRYRAVTQNATEIHCASHGGSLAFEYGNRLLFGAACQHATFLGSDVRLLAVWDGRPGDDMGGTADFIEMAHEMGRAVEVIRLDETGSAAAPPRPPIRDSDERLLSMLGLSISDDETQRRVAALLPESGVVHREIFGEHIRLFFETPAAAARTAIRIASETSETLGLHAGPVRVSTHPLIENRVIRGEHARKADDLAALEPPGIIYSSQEFAALLGLNPVSGVRCEFLGHRALRKGSAREPIFQLRK